MPKTAAKFGSELQLALQPMILKPSTAGGVQVGDEIPCLECWITPDVQALQETVACLCAVVQHLTHDFTRLVGLLKSCNGMSKLNILRNALILFPARLRSAAQKTQMSPTDLRTLSILIFIISLLVENCDFDRLRTEQTGSLS